MLSRQGTARTRIPVADLAAGGHSRDRHLVSRHGLALMRSWFHSTIGIVVTIFLVLTVFAYFALRMATRSHPQPGEHATAKVRDTVEIFRNAFGIPHIVAATLDDAVFAQGYAHAQDRLWQMDLYRRIGRGRVAEVTGPEAVSVDVFMRTLGIADIARRQLAAISAPSRAALEAYARGVNAYLDENAENLAFEFDALGYTPDHWSAEDCLIVGRMIAFELSLGFWSDIAYAQIAAQRTQPVARMYIPTGRAGEPTVLDTARTTTPVSGSPSDRFLQTPAAAVNGVASLLRRVRSTLDLQGSGIGSNAWAVSRGSGKGALLANDPHMSVGMPPKFYQVHLSTPTMNVVGLSVPGLPMVVCGRNDSVAWGVTNVMQDDVDYFIERVDERNSNYYFDAQGQRTKFRYRRDTIRINGQPDSLVDIRYTARSAVISDAHLLLDPSTLFDMPRERASSLLTKSCLTFRWTATTRSDEVRTLIRLAHARGVGDVQRAVTTWQAPAFNLTFATTQGLVGTIPMGIAPVRSLTDPHFLNPGWDARYDWQGTVPLTQAGSYITTNGHAVAANQTLSVRPSPYIGTLYEPSSRAERIHELLSMYDDYRVRDAQLMQQDVLSPYARSFLARLLPILRKGAPRYGALEKQVLALLAKWDGTCSTIEPSAAVYAAFQQRMIVNTFEDELGQQLFMDWAFVGNIPVRRISELIDDPTHILFDDRRTPQREQLSWIAIRSFIEAVQMVREAMNNDQPTQWRYGTLHTITFGHRFGRNPLMRYVMNQGPFEMAGMGTTINNSEWPVYKPFDTRVAAAMRMICDLQDSVVYSVVPGGASGQPLDRHYADQVQLWMKGGYVRMPVQRRPPADWVRYTTFTPAS
ncbi:MAG: penicillin acylase family protein [Candidatus Kapabacteria bacterium]|nr:penicillin acylase family protein [Candidatus Kapabacteria bacterium]